MRPLPIKVAVVMHIILATGAALHLAWMDPTGSRSTRLCFEGYLLANIIGCVAIWIRATGAPIHAVTLHALFWFRVLQYSWSCSIRINSCRTSKQCIAHPYPRLGHSAIYAFAS